jgi:hypothetical protein
MKLIFWEIQVMSDEIWIFQGNKKTLPMENSSVSVIETV